MGYFLSFVTPVSNKRISYRYSNVRRATLLYYLPLATEKIRFTEKQHVQTANNPRSPQSCTNAQRLLASQPTLFFVTIYLQLKILLNDTNIKGSG